MFKQHILCINDLVDGVTKNKIYTAIYCEMKQGKIYYGLYDDYGVYNLFLEERFIPVTEDLIDNIIEFKNKEVN